MGNIAFKKNTAASSYVLPYAPSFVVDGQATVATPLNRWLSNSLPAWVNVDLAGFYLVDRWVVKHMPVAGWQSPHYVNSDFKLQGSNDASTWFDIDSVVGNTGVITDRQINPSVYRYYRVYFTKGLITNPQLASFYELEIYQAFSAQLKNLTISTGTLTPVFAPGTLAYTASVTGDVSSITVTPTALSPTASITVNGTAAPSGQPFNVNLAYGTNPINIVVTDGTVTQTYTITVTRPAPAYYLSSLTVQSRNGAITLNPGFIKTTSDYTASVANAVSAVTFTPTAESPSATITINGTSVSSGAISQSFNLKEGSNTFNIVVTNGGQSFTYKVVISRDYNLLLTKAVVAYTGRGISGNVTVTMDATNLNYNASVPTGATAVIITPYASNATVVVRVNSAIVPAGSSSVSIPLAASGATSITISVTSSDGMAVRTYTINVTKQ